MAKGIQFSGRAAERIVRTVKAVESGNGFTIGGTSQASGGYSDCWLKIYDADGFPDPQTYTVYLYATPFAAQPISDTRYNALNVWEIGNDSESGCGYAYNVDPTDPAAVEGANCGDIIGLEQLPGDLFVRCLGRVYKDGQWYFLFSERPDPKIKGAG